MVESGSSRELGNRSSLMNLRKFQSPVHSQAHVGDERIDHLGHQQQSMIGNGGGEGFNKEIRELEEMFSKLNPMAQEFVPPSISTSGMTMKINGGYFAENVAAASYMKLNEFPGNSGEMGRRGVLFFVCDVDPKLCFFFP